MRAIGFLLAMGVSGFGYAAQQCATESGETYVERPQGSETPARSNISIRKGDHYETGEAVDGWSSVRIGSETVWARSWIFAFSCQPSPAWIPPGRERQPTLSRAAFVEKAKAVLTKDFKDPDSAKFRGLAVYQDNLDKALVLCGEVNAKNSYGAYVGYAPFYATETSASMKEGAEDALFDTLRMGYCHKRLAAVK